MYSQSSKLYDIKNGKVKDKKFKTFLKQLFEVSIETFCKKMGKRNSP